MIKFLSFILVLFVGITSFAKATTMAAMPQQQFQELTKKVVETGKLNEGIAGIYLTVANIEDLPESSSHQADYISTIGGYDSASKYHFTRVEIVSERWHRIEEGRWDIDQWLFAANTKGEISFARHVHMVQTANGTVLIHETVPSETAQEELQWDIQVNKWYTRLLVPKPIPAGQP
ncbi:hypothetical protein D3C87_1036070 [compost metagenome]